MPQKQTKDADKEFLAQIEKSLQKSKDWLREEEFNEIINRIPIFYK